MSEFVSLEELQEAVTRFALASGWAIQFTDGADDLEFVTDSGAKISFAKATKDFLDAGAESISSFEGAGNAAISTFEDAGEESISNFEDAGEAAIEALQQIPIVLIASGNEFRPDTDFGKLLSIDGSTSYLYLPGGSANDVGKRLWVTSANASFLYDYSDIEYYGQTTPGVLYMAVATSFASGSLRWKVSLDQTNVNLTGVQTIGGTKTFSSAPRSSGALSGNANEIPNISQIYAMLVNPDNIIIREEMLSLANWSDASSGTGFINIGGSALFNSGSFQINSGATLGGRGVAAFGGFNFWPQQHNPWRAVFCFTLNTLANVRIRVGFSVNPAGLWTSRFTGLSYNSSLSPNLRFVNDSGSSPVFTDTGVAASTGSFKLTMRGSTDGQIYISINDGAETLITGGLTFGVRSIFGIENLASGSARFEADFFSYFGTINR